MTEAASHKAPNLSSPSQASAELAPVRSAGDATVRPVVVSLLLTGLFWLTVSALFGFLVAVKLQFPEFCNWSFLNFGRLAPAADASFTFGWSSSAAMAVGVWVVARSSGRAPSTWLVSFGAVLWNGGVLIGVVSLLAGMMRPFTGLEFPTGVYGIMFAGLCFVATWLAVTFRAGGTLSLSLMFTCGGVAWLGWSLLTGNLLLALQNVTGVVQQISASWVASGVIWLWLVPVALGAAYYVVPKASGQPIHSGALGRALFWFYFITAGLVSSARLSGGPVPLWVGSLAAATTILLLVPIVGTAYNLYCTARHSNALHASPSLRFILFGLGVLSVVSVLSALSVLRSVDYAVHFTSFETGLRSLLLRGSVSMILFGSIYYMMPRLSGCEWLSSTLINWHFLGSAYGSCISSVMLILSGFAAGSVLGDAESNFSQVLELANSYYWGNTISLVLLLSGYAVFVLHFLLMAVRIGQPAGEPTLLPSHEH